MIMIDGTWRKCPWARLRHRITVDERLEQHYRSDLLYSPKDLLYAEGFVYQLRFSEPVGNDVKQARYYIGSAATFESLLQRMRIHAQKPHHPAEASIVTAAHAVGAEMTLIRLWQNVRHRDMERYLKSRGHYERHDPVRGAAAFANPGEEVLQRFRQTSLRRLRHEGGRPALLAHAAKTDGMPF